jgi:signal transduction histidine kinase
MNANLARVWVNEQRYGIAAKWLLLTAGVISLRLQPQRAQGIVVGTYALVTIATTAIVLTRRAPRGDMQRAALSFWLSQLIDVLYVTALIATSGGLATPLYLLYLLLALKSLLYVPDVGGVVWLPFTFGPLYVLALWLAHGRASVAFLADPLFLTRYLLLLGLILGITVVTWTMANRLREVDRLRTALDARTRDLAVQTQTLQRTATDLGDRVLELRSLQEVAKALSATLYLTETLQAIVERLRSLVDSSRCAVALLDVERHVLLRLAVADDTRGSIQGTLRLDGDDALQQALRSGRSQLLHYGAIPAPFLPLVDAWQCNGIEVTPLVTRGQPIGVVLVGWRAAETLPEQVGDQRRRSLLESFAYFAATALENARLYGEVADKSRELEAVLAGIGDAVLVTDPAGALVLINPVAGRILGLQALPVGASLRSALPADELVAFLDETATAGSVQMRELPISTAGLSSDGQPRTFQALAAPLYRTTETPGALVVGGVVAVLRDITAQKELERMKSNFLSVVSHELKTPLHSIKGFVEIILMGKTGPITDLQRDFLGTVQEQTGHLQRLIEDLLEFSRLESGQVRLRPIWVSPLELAGAVMTKLSPLAADRQLALEMALPADLPAIEVDAMRVEQVLTNLVENAIKFTPEGGRVRMMGWDRGDMIEIAVADTGIGIPQGERERVFERFYQVDSSVRRRYKGTGLGLTICKHIVTQHGGRIWIEDPRWEAVVAGGNGVAADAHAPGSEFHFTLPKVFVHPTASTAALDFGALHPATVYVTGAS